MMKKQESKIKKEMKKVRGYVSLSVTFIVKIFQEQSDKWKYSFENAYIE
jgi:hypothetical protein